LKINKFPSFRPSKSNESQDKSGCKLAKANHSSKYTLIKLILVIEGNQTFDFSRLVIKLMYPAVRLILHEQPGYKKIPNPFLGKDSGLLKVNLLLSKLSQFH
jgi:hypothetical protein